MRNSIVAGNENEFQTTNFVDLALGSNIDAGDPLLAPLGDYGGPTHTMPPLPGSPAINSGGSSNPGGTDQRGFPRFINNFLDIGAVEFQGVAEELEFAFDEDIDGDGTSVGVELAIGTNPRVADLDNRRHLSLSSANGSELPQYSFGLDRDQLGSESGEIILKLTRSTDLINFDVVVESNESSPFTGFLDELTATDPSPPAEGKAFYRLEAIRVP